MSPKATTELREADNLLVSTVETEFIPGVSVRHGADLVLVREPPIFFGFL